MVFGHPQQKRLQTPEPPTPTTPPSIPPTPGQPVDPEPEQLPAIPPLPPDKPGEAPVKEPPPRQPPEILVLDAIGALITQGQAEACSGATA
jgi:hypothetical protein